MALRFGRRKEQLEAKAARDVTTPGVLDALTNGQAIQYTPDGSLSFFQMFGSSYGRLYRTQSALRAVVDFLSRNIGGIHMRVYHRDAEGVALPTPEHPVQQLLDHPQRGVPYSRLMRAIVADKAIYDVAAVWKIRENFDPTNPNEKGFITNTGAVRELVRIPIPFVSIYQGSLTSPLTFRLVSGPTPITLPVEDVIWMPGYAPDSNIAGVPPVETLRQILAEEWAAGKDRENLWKQGVTSSLVFTQDPARELEQDAVTRFGEQMRAKYGGVNASNAKEWPVLPAGLKPEQLIIDAQSAEYLATRNLAREECCRAYGIQPQLLGITPANFASMDMFHQMLYQDTLTPWCVATQEEFEEQLLVEFESVDSGYYIDFNINAKLQGSFLDQAKIGQQAVGGPWMTRNEFREKFQGLPPVDGGDEIIVPLNVVLAGGDQANPADATNQFNAEVLPDGVVTLTRKEGTA